MEKCTFCIQRITTAEIDARTEGRKMVDGEIITACAQACPTRAISFGDINDPDSAMMKRRADNKVRNYTMLPEFNALAGDHLSTRYLLGRRGRLKWRPLSNRDIRSRPTSTLTARSSGLWRRAASNTGCGCSFAPF